MILPDSDTCYRAVQARDARFDGWFFTAVRTTGIYCRPSCPAITPRRRNVEFFASAAAAQQASYRACKRCRPDATPGSPEWDVRGDLTGRALRLIADGVIDRDGVPGLARRLGYSQRQLSRTLLTEVGAGPLALARAQRAQTARILLETTAMSVADVAFSAGFASVRQFNETIRAVFATTPTALRSGRRVPTGDDPASITLRLPYREPFDLTGTLDFLGTRAIPGVEEYADGVFSRTVRAPGGPAAVRISTSGEALACRVSLTDQRDLVSVVARVRRLLDLDADPTAIDEQLGTDPQLAPLIAKRPGIRSPGAVDGFEMAVRAVVGQQISVRGARTLLGQLAAKHGRPVFGGQLLFPSAAVFAAVDPDVLPMPRARARTLLGLANAVAAGELNLDPGSDRDREQSMLLALPGVGRWTAGYVRMRTMNDPDVLLDTDLGVRKSAAAAGIDLGTRRPDWRPWRSYASHHLWAALH